MVRGRFQRRKTGESVLARLRSTSTQGFGVPAAFALLIGIGAIRWHAGPIPAISSLLIAF